MDYIPKGSSHVFSNIGHKTTNRYWMKESYFECRKCGRIFHHYYDLIRDIDEAYKGSDVPPCEEPMTEKVFINPLGKKMREEVEEQMKGEEWWDVDDYKVWIDENFNKDY